MHEIHWRGIIRIIVDRLASIIMFSYLRNNWNKEEKTSRSANIVIIRQESVVKHQTTAYIERPWRKWSVQSKCKGEEYVVYNKAKEIIQSTWERIGSKASIH